jgi:hypothetical protein
MKRRELLQLGGGGLIGLLAGNIALGRNRSGQLPSASLRRGEAGYIGSSMIDQEPCRWEHIEGDDSQVEISVDGSIVAKQGANVSFLSQTVTGDYDVIWDTDWRRMGALGLSPYPLVPNQDGTGVLVVRRLQDPGYMEAEFLSGLKRPIMPEMQLKIEVRKRIASYYINDKLWLESYQWSVLGKKLPETVRVAVTFFGLFCEPQAVLRCRLQRY